MKHRSLIIGILAVVVGSYFTIADSDRFLITIGSAAASLGFVILYLVGREAHAQKVIQP